MSTFIPCHGHWLTMYFARVYTQRHFRFELYLSEGCLLISEVNDNMLSKLNMNYNAYRISPN
jgi:hypothetical protein